MIKIGGKRPRPRLIVLKSDPLSKPSRPPERTERLDEVLAQLRSIDPSQIPANIICLGGKVFPGKGLRIARVDMLETVVEAGRRETFTHLYTTTPDDGISLPERVKISPLLEGDWQQLEATGDPGFVAAMRAMNSRSEIEQQEGDETLLAEPFVAKDDRVLGCMVVSNLTWRGICLFTAADRETARSFARQISNILVPAKK